MPDFNSVPFTARGAPRSLSVTVSASGTESILNVRAPATVHIIPGESGSMTCQWRAIAGGPLTDLDPDTPSFTDTDGVGYKLESPVYELVFTATTAAGTGVVACQ